MGREEFGEDVDPESVRLLKDAEREADREKISFREAFPSGSGTAEQSMTQQVVR